MVVARFQVCLAPPRTNNTIFKIVLFDVSSTSSVRDALGKLRDPIDALILNAGGAGGKTPMAMTSDGVTYLFAQNVLGHAVLLEGFLSKGLLTQVAIFVGSEGARGVSQMGIKRPNAATLPAFMDIITGKAYKGQKVDVFSAYGAAKYIGALWMSSLARRYPKLRLVTISPGGTKGTNAAESMPPAMRFFAKYIFRPLIATPLGLNHSLDVGAKRIVDGLFELSLQSGHFYASSEKTLTGPLVDQSDIYTNFGDLTIQDAAAAAVQKFAN
jgi:NAD(P)-dependent dehydrogenase (short-subunit alcohol dehydrogenase family)